MIRNINPEAAQLTSDVLDRIIYLREDMNIPHDISLSLLKQSVSLIKRLLKIYQPTWAQSVSLKEGKRKKGGHNDFPSTPRPALPKGQASNV